MPRNRQRDPDQEVGGLAERLADWPLLRLLMLNRPFRWVVILFVLGVVGLALMLPKVWRTTPQGFEPEVRISLLDRVQAWSLKRNALRSEGANLPEAAMRGYRAAWANNPADLTALRGMIRTIPETPDPEESVNLALQSANWLLRLDNTNRTDLEPIAWAWIRSGASERVMSLVEILEPPFSEDIERLRLVALFEAGRLREFQAALDAASAWEQRVQAALGEDPRTIPEGISREFVLVSLAYLAGASPDASTRNDALKGLRAARSDRATEQRAYNLEYTTRLNQRDVDKCRELLAEMREIGKDSVRHHTALWRLLLAEGRGEEALRMATQANLKPRTVWDAYQLALAWSLLGRLDFANDLLRAYSRSIGYLGESLLLRGDVLMRKAGVLPETRTYGLPDAGPQEPNDALDELRSLALDIRAQPDAMDVLGGYSDFLEGLVEWKRGHRDDNGLDEWLRANPTKSVTDAPAGVILPGTAAFFFNQAVRAGFPTPALAAQISTVMMTLGKVGPWVEPILLAHRDKIFAEARDLLEAEARRTVVPEERRAVGQYLGLMIRCAAIRGNRLQGDYLLQAADLIYRLYPNDATAANYYAAALLIFRQKPETAISLTLRLMRANPRSRALAINHAEALLQNGRADEAETILRSVVFTEDEMKGKIPELSQYYLACFEANRRLGNVAEAQQFLSRVDPKDLYPPQLVWLQGVRKEFESGIGRPG